MICCFTINIYERQVQLLCKFTYRYTMEKIKKIFVGLKSHMLHLIIKESLVMYLSVTRINSELICTIKYHATIKI